MGMGEQTTDGQQAPLNESGSAGETAIFPALQPSTTLLEPAPGTAAQPAASAAPSAPASPAAQVTAQSQNSPANGVASPATTTAATTSEAATAATAVAGTPGALRFNFQEQSWVTVRDVNDKVLISQLNEAGSNLEVRGLAPFKLIVGNARAVKVTSNGKAVDLNASISGEVARVTVR